MSLRAPAGRQPSVLVGHHAPAAPAHVLRLRQLAVVAFVTFATAASGQLAIPLAVTPVPFTLQPLVVLFAGAALGARLGAASQALFLTLGLAGLPVFAASPILPQGGARLLGPTGGYLLAFPLAAFIVGYFVDRGWLQHAVLAAVAFTAGLTTIYVAGIAGLMLTTGAPLVVAAAQGAGVFFVADLLKAIAAAALVPVGRAFFGSPDVPKAS
jgi:biotin transport system substrate-specific component